MLLHLAIFNLWFVEFMWFLGEIEWELRYPHSLFALFLLFSFLWWIGITGWNYLSDEHLSCKNRRKGMKLKGKFKGERPYTIFKHLLIGINMDDLGWVSSVFVGSWRMMVTTVI